MQTEILKVTGMTCSGCTSTVTRALKATPGVDDVNVSLSAGEATVRYDRRLARQSIEVGRERRRVWRRCHQG